MNLADKIIALRKRNGWSQEELADKLDVSRQSVSKWEGGQSTPDINKIIALSQLFGVSTDYLLKDESEPTKIDTPAKRLVTMEDARKFLALRRDAAQKIAIATFLCILSPIPMFAMLAMREEDLRWICLNENAASGIGMAVLLLLVAVACGLFISCGMRVKPYEFLEYEDFDTEYGVIPMVRQVQEEFIPTYSRCNVTGTVLCVLCAVPLMLAVFSGGEGHALLGLCVLLLLVGVGVLFFIYGGVICASTEKLLKEGDYTALNKRIQEKTRYASATFWLITTAIYLAWSFTENFAVSWIIWPVNGLIFAAFMVILKQVLRNQYSKQ